jgi:hypothetical protein
MATLIACADTGLTTSTTWNIADSASGAIQATISTGEDTGTSYAKSTAFTITNAKAVVGVMLSCVKKNSTGTVTVCLSVDGTAETRTVVVNASDLPTYKSWVVFNFSSLTSGGESTYKVMIKSSSAANATFYRDDTAGNWAHLIQTTDNQTPAANNILMIGGSFTTTSAAATRTVTMDAISSSITIYGQVNIGWSGKLDYGTTASTNYYLELAGMLNVWSGGTLQIGQYGGTVIPATSTAVLEFNCASAEQYYIYLYSGSTLNTCGATKTVSALLAANASANATSLTTDISTGWLNGDEIAIAPTGAYTTYTQAEKKTLSADASTTTLTIAAITNAHSGTTNYQAELGNLTRNVKIRGISAANVTKIYINSTVVTINCYYTQFTYVSYTFHAYLASSSTVNIRYCAFDFSIWPCYLWWCDNATLGSTVNCYYNVVYNGGGVFLSSFTNLICTVDHCVFIGGPGYGWSTGNGGNIATLTATYNSVSGKLGDGIILSEWYNGSLDNNTFHTNNGAGMYLNPYDIQRFICTVSNNICWRNIQGIYLFLPTSATGQYITGGSLYGNSTSNLQIYNSGNIVLKDVVFNGGVTTVAPFAIKIQNNDSISNRIKCINCSFGVTTAHGTASIDRIVNNGVFTAGMLVDFINCVWSDTTFIDANTIASLNKVNNIYADLDRITFLAYNQTANDNRRYTYYSINKSDTVIYTTKSARSERITPTANCASTGIIRAESSKKSFAVNASTTSTFSVQVRKSKSTDAGGINYAGSPPRLILKACPEAGIAADVVLATDTGPAALGTWFTLSGNNAAAQPTCDTVLEVVVDCAYLTALGWVNVADWSVS